jgi:hypothetical protein
MVLHVLKRALRSIREILGSEHSSTQVNSPVSDGVIGRIRLKIKNLCRREGCMTDQVLANIKKKLEGNVDDLDGLESLKYVFGSVVKS